MRIPILPLFAKSVGASTVEVGFITSLFMGIAALLSIPMGALSDRVGRQRLIILGLGLSAATSFLLSSAGTPGEIMAVYAIAGLAIASFSPAMASFVGDVTQQARMGWAYGWYTTAMQMGMALGPALGGLAAEREGYEWSFLLSGGVILVPLVMAVVFLPSPGAQAPKKSGLDQSLRGLLKLGRTRGVAACWLAVFSIAFSFGAFMPFFPLYAQGVELTAASIGLLFTIQSLLNALGRMPSGYLSDMVGRRGPFIVGGMLVFAVLTAALTLSADLYVLTVMVSLLGLSMGVATMALSTSLSESVRRLNRGMAMGGFGTAMYGGFAVSATVTGWLISVKGYGLGFLAAGIICAMGAVTFHILHRHREKG